MTEKLLRLAKKGNSQAVQKVYSNVHRLAKRWEQRCKKDPGADHEGNIAAIVWECIKKYDLKANTKFTTYLFRALANYAYHTWNARTLEFPNLDVVFATEPDNHLGYKELVKELLGNLHGDSRRLCRLVHFPSADARKRLATIIGARRINAAGELMGLKGYKAKEIYRSRVMPVLLEFVAGHGDVEIRRICYSKLIDMRARVCYSIMYKIMEQVVAMWELME